MADKILRVDYFYVEIPDRPGEGSRILGILKEAGVNLLSFTAFPIASGKAQVDLVPEKAESLIQAAKKAGLALSPKKQAFLVRGKDRVGAVGEIFKKLSDARINVHAANAACSSDGGFGCILWVKPQQIEAAAKALGL
jgi:hypothetical protein